MFVASFNANALYPATIHSDFIELAQADASAPLWLEAVHQEWMGTLARKRPDLAGAPMARLRRLSEAEVGDVTVTSI